jgi:hypothetical protein
LGINNLPIFSDFVDFQAGLLGGDTRAKAENGKQKAAATVRAFVAPQPILEPIRK